MQIEPYLKTINCKNLILLFDFELSTTKSYLSKKTFLF